MRHPLPLAALAGLLTALALSAVLPGPRADAPKKEAPKADDGGPDSYYYYGPGGLWKKWTKKDDPEAAKMRLGRDTWIHYTWGNQKFLRAAAVAAGGLAVPVSVDFFRVVDSRNRKTRFRDLGLINEPNCGGKDDRDSDHDEEILRKYGLYIDKWRGDPRGYYPGEDGYHKEYGSTYPGTDEKVNTRNYGRPAGVVGLRLFDNPRFDKEAQKKWDAREYFRNPGKVEPPFLFGFSCGFCHVAFDPESPPADPERPRWNNLAANVGNQYFREGEIFLAKGRVIFGDARPQPGFARDPYQTAGLTEADFLHHYAVTQQPGTSETSRLSYDFINNPNTINPIFLLPLRVPLARGQEETTPWGKQAKLKLNILKDGADSVGLRWALMRVPINIGCEGDYWLSRLFDPRTGRKGRPFHIGEALFGLPDAEKRKVEAMLGPVFEGVTKARFQELRRQFKSRWARDEGFGDDWAEGWKRMEGLEAYLLSYGQPRLASALAGMKGRKALPPEKEKALAPDPKLVEKGKDAYFKACAECHSSTLAGKKGEGLEKAKKAFPKDDWLADDRRHPVSKVGTNMARALGTNAIDGDIWAEFSSKEYKGLPPPGRFKFKVPVVPKEAPVSEAAKTPIEVEFEPPGGGRGYYRTPSLIGMWATAPYLHNNALGDYWAIDEKGKSVRVPNDGRRVGRKLDDGRWADYRIDVSVEGRLRMFEDAMDKMLNPERRHYWVKRTSAPSTLLPYVERVAPQLLLAVAREGVRRELKAWLEAEHVPGKLQGPALEAADRVFSRVAPGVLEDARVTLRVGVALAHLKLRDHADRLLDLAHDALKERLAEVLGDKLKGKAEALAALKSRIRTGLMAKLDGLEKDLSAASLLTVPSGTPVNLYANLNLSSVPYALLAAVRHRHDPRALAEALLKLSDCPDLVEDKGHLYGTADDPRGRAHALSVEEKKALIEFLKTL